MKEENKTMDTLVLLSKFLLIGLVFALPIVQAVDLNTPPTADEKAQFDTILTPISKIYKLVTYAASIIATLMLLFAGINYMRSGNDVKQRETSKHMATYVLVGVAVIWAAPYVVTLLIG